MSFPPPNYKVSNTSISPHMIGIVIFFSLYFSPYFAIISRILFLEQKILSKMLGVKLSRNDVTGLSYLPQDKLQLVGLVCWVHRHLEMQQ